MLRKISFDGRESDVQNFVAGENIRFVTQSDGTIQINGEAGGGSGGCVSYNFTWDAATKSFVLTDSDSAVVQREAVTGFASEDVTGDLADLVTTDQSSLVAAINEVAGASGEPFRVKNWASNSLNVSIPICTDEIANTSIPQMIFTIDDTEGAEYQIVGMIAYEVFDAASGGNRINCWPVCQFTGNGQKSLTVRMMCGGTSAKTARRINAWVLLKRR